MGQIAIFGGSFDPVHNAHIQTAMLAQENFNLKKIIFVTAYTPPHKNRQYADIYDRVAMVKKAVKNMKNIEVSYFEAEKQEIVYTYQTLDYFSSLYPDDEILMIIGSDSLIELDTWKNIDYLASKYRFIVAKRPNVKISPETKYLERCLFIDTETEDISSTAIRKMLEKRDDRVLKYIDNEVYEYIIENGLYK